MFIQLPKLTLFFILLLVHLTPDVFAQQPIENSGRFYFYGPKMVYDTIYPSGYKNNKKVGSSSLSAQKKVNQLNAAFTNSYSGQQKSYIVTGSITLSVTTQDPSCGYDNGIITVVASGGTSPYIYTINNGAPQNTGNFPRRRVGTYTVTVTDVNSETATATVTLGNTLAPISAQLQYKNATSCAANDATVTVLAGGGTPPYTYTMDRIHFQSSNVFTGLSSGDYVFYAKDANGCMAAAYTWPWGYDLACSGVPLQIGYSLMICKPNTGNINIKVTDNNGPYLYSIDGVNFQAQGNFNNLSVGTYHIYIKNGSGLVLKYAFTFFRIVILLLTI